MFDRKKAYSALSDSEKREKHTSDPERDESRTLW